MDEVQKQRAITVIASIQRALDQGVAHFNREGRRLGSVVAIIDAWAHGGLTIKDPRNDEVINTWIQQRAAP
jgi:hypothetical protein